MNNIFFFAIFDDFCPAKIQKKLGITALGVSILAKSDTFSEFFSSFYKKNQDFLYNY